MEEKSTVLFLASAALFASAILLVLATSGMDIPAFLQMESQQGDSFPAGECVPIMENGPEEEKIDLLLVAKDYSSDKNISEDFRYFMDFDGNNRGLFAVYPFNETKERFNIWVLDAQNISDYQDPRQDRGLIKDSREKFQKCDFADYKAVLAKEGMGRAAFAYPQNNALYVKGVREKRLAGGGATGFLHEWGHAFASLKDEYYSEDGRDSWGRPNCADNMTQARNWWGDLAEEKESIGFYNGCSYEWGNIKPHPNNTIMGGGKWGYGAVNNRKIWSVLNQYS